MLKRSALALAVVAVIAAALWLADVAADRRYVVAVVGPEPLLSLPPHEYPKVNPVVETLLPGQSLRVLRVRYGKDFEAFKVEAPSGRSGWVLSGGGVHVISRGQQNGG